MPGRDCQYQPVQPPGLHLLQFGADQFEMGASCHFPKWAYWQKNQNLRFARIFHVSLRRSGVQPSIEFGEEDLRLGIFDELLDFRVISGHLHPPACSMRETSRQRSGRRFLSQKIWAVTSGGMCLVVFSTRFGVTFPKAGFFSAMILDSSYS